MQQGSACEQRSVHLALQKEALMKTALLFSCVILAACSRNDTSDADHVSSTRVTSAAFPEAPAGGLDEAPLLTRALEAEIASHPQLASAARNVEVSVTDGIVTFRGAVASAEAKSALDAVARSELSVVDTLNKVEISPSRAADEAEIDDRIAFSLQRSLMDQPAVAGRVDHVTIDVTRGRVTLRGTTPDPGVRDSLEQIAGATPGVTSVTDRLRVVERCLEAEAPSRPASITYAAPLRTGATSPSTWLMVTLQRRGRNHESRLLPGEMAAGAAHGSSRLRHGRGRRPWRRG
jgi:osmotically-inducible protein OsmY